MSVAPGGVIVLSPRPHVEMRVARDATVARDLTLLEFGEGYVWVGPPTHSTRPGGFIRRYRLVPEDAG